MSQLNQESHGAGTMNEQQLDQISRALYSYCKVMSEPKMGPAPAVITVLVGVIPALLLTALGESLLTAVVVGAPLIALFAFLWWLAYRYYSGY
jgi:ABC-type branched-subunit amino acid transport system ATPase component